MASVLIAVSTSRKPSQRTRSFCKELAMLLPSATYFQRGKQGLIDLAIQVQSNKAQLLLIVSERDGNPGSFRLYNMNNPLDPIISLRIDGLKLAREFGSRVGSPTRALSIVTDGGRMSQQLADQLHTQLLGGRVARGNRRGKTTRFLAISEVETGSVRLIFKDSENRLELGPSITASCEPIE